MTTFKRMLEEIESAPPRDPVEVIAETLDEMEEIDYKLPPLTPGARSYLAQYDGSCQRLTVEAQGIAANYGSLKTHRMHAVKAAQRLGLHGRNSDE